MLKLFLIPTLILTMQLVAQGLAIGVGATLTARGEVASPSGTQPLVVHGDGSQGLWVFLVDEGTALYKGRGSPDAGFRAAPPVCCLESSIEIGPFHVVGALTHFKADFLYCEFVVCYTGWIEGEYAEASA